MQQFLILTLLIVSFITTAQAETLTGWVTQINNGDTITIQDYSNQQHKIRLAGIAAPEIFQSGGSRAQQNLGALLNNRDVAVEWQRKDNSGRIIGKVMIAPLNISCPDQRNCPKTLDAGLQQIKAGMAWWYRNEAREQSPEDRTLYEQAEFDAKVHRYGLWAETNPVPPWVFRRE